MFRNYKPEEDITHEKVYEYIQRFSQLRVVTENCISLPCPDITLDLSLTDQDICIDESGDIILDFVIKPRKDLLNAQCHYKL